MGQEWRPFRCGAVRQDGIDEAFEPWQERDINYFMTARLTPQQLHYLVVDWGWAMGKCRDARLERWFLTQLDVAIKRTQGLSHQADRLTSFWDAPQRADSPGIRTYLWNLMLDEGKSEDIRNVAANVLFGHLGADEARAHYLRAFETRHLPRGFAGARAEILLHQNPDGLLHGVAERVRADPELTQQAAFDAVAQFCPDFASPAARRELAGAIEQAEQAPGLPQTARAILRAYVRRVTPRVP